jgi:hypothetical protein
MYCLNVYTSDLQPAWLPPGSVKRLRVLEGVPENGEQTHRVPPLAPRRILGDVPVEKDGSFNIEIPANTAIELQTLDADGMALRSCGWIWVKDRARQGCIGCHEDPELTPENIVVDAVKRPSDKLMLPAEERRIVDFRRDVMPIVVGKCVRCHAGVDAPVRFTSELTAPPRNGLPFNQTYRNLLSLGPQSQQGQYVHPGRARISPLIWRLYGRNTSRPWDHVNRTKTPARMPPDGAPALTDQEKRAFVEWIDTGALWDGLPAVESSPSDNSGGGQ